MDLKEHEPLGPKTTMRIGGTAKFYAEIATKEDVEAAYAFAQEKGLPLIVLGGGSNTIFDDGEINALVIRFKAAGVAVDGDRVSVESGKNLPMLINELAKQDLDLSPLTGILGTVGGAIFGNAGQGAEGIWIDHYVENVTVFMNGEWLTLDNEECHFRYRESIFKHMPERLPIIWSTTLKVPRKPVAEIQAEIERLLKKRIETQPHVKTAGSCFKAVKGTPAWQLIDAAGLRGHSIGGVQIAEKHANFLLNTGGATFEDAKKIVEAVQEKVSDPLDVEMRFVKSDGSLAF